MKIPYLDLSVSDLKFKDELLHAVDKVLSHGRIILGPEVEDFEEKIAKYCGKKYAVGVNSGTDALYLSLRALDIGPGDEVITTPLSWIATLNSIVLCGATPIFVDIAEDLNINAELIQDALTTKTKALLPVHFTGKMCNMPMIAEISSKHGLFLIEDSAQAFGSKIHGAMAGSFGDISCFSMNPMKNFNAFGETGAIVTDDRQLYEKLISLRYAGTVNKENCHYPSLNCRIDTIQAAMLLVNFNYFEEKIKKRRKIALYYSKELEKTVVCPKVDEGIFHTYYSYTITTPKKDKLKEFLLEKGIETKIQHPILMPYHNAYCSILPKYKLPVAEKLVDQILCIPNHEKMDFEEVEYVVKCIKEFFRKY